ncbi:carbohydrate ABC transporter permease [Amnibacterium sp. CER49]|uniref:carbohydrate ABC transporter permease n=1 Tax=Amnibacterium sp. CER49 TaxID=3039161 RepID=UPI0024494889|nr:carbohydrate ABC transporter permease [Amnibacterium sp. CER49]MDH2443331.1 carbohydrate ABC transporter permease [Amnibacterium sp. CER49]
MAATVAVGAAAALSLVPFAFLVIVSLQPSPDDGSSLWVQLFTRVPIGQYMLNSAIVSLGSALIVLVVSCAAGFGFAKLPYPGSRLALGLVVAAISVPVATTILPNYLNLSNFGGVGTYWGPTLMYAAGATPFSTILMTNFFRSLPDELVEAGVADGAGYFRIFASVMVPLSAPALATTGVLAFLGAWNDLLIALLFLPDPETRTISVAVASLESVRSSNLDLVLTGSLLSAIPPVIAFVVFQRYLVSGITAGINK